MDATFKVTAVAETAARTRVKARGFEIIVDEPPSLGGDNLGANPVEYVLAGFVGCVNVLGHLVAAEMGFQINELALEAEGTLNPDKLFGRSASERAGLKEIALTVHVDADANAEQLAEWRRRVEERCPVADNLKHTTHIRPGWVPSHSQRVAA